MVITLLLKLPSACCELCLFLLPAFSLPQYAVENTFHTTFLQWGRSLCISPLIHAHLLLLQHQPSGRIDSAQTNLLGYIHGQIHQFSHLILSFFEKLLHWGMCCFLVFCLTIQSSKKAEERKMWWYSITNVFFGLSLVLLFQLTLKVYTEPWSLFSNGKLKCLVYKCPFYWVES